MTNNTREPINPDALGPLQAAFDRAWEDFPREVLRSVQAETARDLLAKALVAARASGVTGDAYLARAALRGVFGDSLDERPAEPRRTPRL